MVINVATLVFFDDDAAGMITDVTIGGHLGNGSGDVNISAAGISKLTACKIAGGSGAVTLGGNIGRLVFTCTGLVADLNWDGIVDLSDFSLFAGQWLQKNKAL